MRDGERHTIIYTLPIVLHFIMCYGRYDEKTKSVPYNPTFHYYTNCLTAFKFSWCSWLSHQSNTLKVSSSNLDENNSFLIVHDFPGWKGWRNWLTVYQRNFFFVNLRNLRKFCVQFPYFRQGFLFFLSTPRKMRIICVFCVNLSMETTTEYRIRMQGIVKR